MRRPSPGHVLPGSVTALVAMNLLPLVGVLWFGWSLIDLLVVYWVESGGVGVFQVCKVLLARGEGGRSSRESGPGRRDVSVSGSDPDQPDTDGTVWLAWENVQVAGLFVATYGALWAVYGWILLVMFDEMVPPDLPPVSAVPVALGLVAFGGSHGVSFVTNYWRGGEYLGVGPITVIGTTYRRVLVLQFTILVGAFVVTFLGIAVGPVAVLVALKTAIDLRSHARERGNGDSWQLAVLR